MPAEGVHSSLHVSVHAAWQLPTLVSALLKAFALESAESPAAAGTSQTPLVQASPVAHGRFAEHDCPSVLGEAGVMHLPAEHLFPVSQSLANEHVALHTLLADVVALPQILLVHSEAAVHATFTPFPCVVINVPDGAVFAGILKLESGIVTLPVNGRRSFEDNVFEPLRTAAAHVPILTEPVVTILAQLLLLQSAFSLQYPPVPCKGTQAPSFTLCIIQTFPVSHWVFKVHVAQTLFGLQ